MAAPPAPAPAPALMDELLEECLLRLPPDDPASLVRAALVCKGWRRIVVTDRGFGRRFRELHGSPPMPGFLHIHTRYGSFFTPTSSSRPPDVNAYLRLGGWHAIDCRHGRVLLSSSPSLCGTWWYMRRRSHLAVWDPVSGDQLDLPELPPPPQLKFTSKAAVLCASSSSACDHLDCHRGHFIVVLMDATFDKVCVYVYSSQAGAWSHRTSAAQDHSPRNLLHRQPVSMTRNNVLYFSVHKGMTNGILQYDMGANEVSWVDLPLDCSSQICRTLLTTTEHGGLGIVRVDKNSRLLHLWSREACPNGDLGWAPSGVIELEAVLPANSGSISTVASVHGLGALFIMTNAGAFTVDLVSNRVRKVVCGNHHVNYLVPYTSFCTPALGAAFTGEEPTAGLPSA